MERITEKVKNSEYGILIKTISQILSEIISENKSEMKGKETFGII
jgi:hypothetical protein